MARRAGVVVVSVALLGACLHGCYGATQVTLDIQTDLSCPALPKRLSTQVFLADNADPIADTSACASAADATEVGTLVIAPSGARDGHVRVEVAMDVEGADPGKCRTDEARGTLPPTCIIARRVIGFVPHTQLVVPIRLYKECLGVVCAADQTCSAGRCIDASCGDCTDGGAPLGPIGPADASADVEVPPPPAADAGGDVIPKKACTGPTGTETLLANVDQPAGTDYPSITQTDKWVAWIASNAGVPAGTAVSMTSVRKDDGHVDVYVNDAVADGPASTSAVGSAPGYLWATNASHLLEWHPGSGAASSAASTAGPARAYAYTKQNLPNSLTTTGTVFFLPTGTGTSVYSHAPATTTTSQVPSGVKGDFLAATDTRLYVGAIGGTLLRWDYTPATVPTPSVVASALGGIAAFPGSAVLLNGDGSAVTALPDAQNTPAAVGQTISAKTIATDGTKVYVTENVGGQWRLGRLALPGNASQKTDDWLGASTRFAKISNVVVDNQCVYAWVQRAGESSGEIVVYPK